MPRGWAPATTVIALVLLASAVQAAPAATDDARDGLPSLPTLPTAQVEGALATAADRTSAAAASAPASLLASLTAGLHLAASTVGAAAQGLAAGVSTSVAGLAAGASLLAAGATWLAGSILGLGAAAVGGVARTTLVAATSVALAGAAAAAALASAIHLLSVALGDLLTSILAAPPARHALAAKGLGGAAISGAATAGWTRLLDHAAVTRLYSRLGRDELLDHEVRQGLVDHVESNPGCHVTELADELDLGWGTAIYHLERLTRAKILVSERHGNHRCFFVNGGEVGRDARKAIPALKNDTAREVVAFVTQHPAASQKEVAEALEISPALVSWHVKRLAEAGILRRERQGRGNALFIHEETANPAMAAVA